MNITDVRVRKVAKEGKMKAVVSITIDDEFVVHDIKVIEGEKGLFIAMPSRKASDGEYRDIAHPINSQTREKIQDIILKQYEVAAAQEGDGRRGLGLGLALCKAIINAHGGEIGVRDNSPRGSVFYFTLPAEEVVIHE